MSVSFVFTPTLTANLREIIFCMIEFDFELLTSFELDITLS